MDEHSSGRRSRARQVLPIVGILAATIAAGALLSPGAQTESGRPPGIETGVSPPASPAADPPARGGEAPDPDDEGAAAPDPDDEGAAAPDPAPSAAEDPRPLPDAAQSEGRWDALPEVWLQPRDDEAVAWAGSELLVWGGIEAGPGDPRRSFFADGAAYDPDEHSWRPIADSPLGPRAAAASAWTGSELVIWGGIGPWGMHADGAAYDPASDRWRALPPAPLSARANSAMVWTGDELLVIGGSDNAGSLPDGAAYDPAGDTWRPIADAPIDRTRSMEGVWAEDSAVLWGRAGGAGRAYRYRLARDAWSPLPETGLDGQALLQLEWSGERLFGLARAPGGKSALATLGPGEPGRWQIIADAPALSASGWDATWVDAGLVIAAEADVHLVYDHAAASWSRLPRAPLLQSWRWETISAGSDLVLWGPRVAGPGSSTRGAIFRFAPAGDAQGPDAATREGGDADG